MTIRGKACIAGAWEHPTRKAPEKSIAQLHAEYARGALADAGLGKDDVDGYFCAGDAPGMGPPSMVDYLNLRVRHVDSTDMNDIDPRAWLADVLTRISDHPASRPHELPPWNWRVATLKAAA